MKAIISTTYDDKYLYFLPIVTWLWNKLGVDVICFVPSIWSDGIEYKMAFVSDTIKKNNLRCEIYYFDSPHHKQSTYAQCSRLYGACLDLPEHEVLITCDIDMGMFQLPRFVNGTFSVFGSDLVPDKQLPICYLIASVKQWRDTFELNGKTYQECLDLLLGEIEAEHFRGNFWSKDQEVAHNMIMNNTTPVSLIQRATQGTQFAGFRYDRDDSYILDRLSLDTIDYHMNRPGFRQDNFDIILKIINYHYPHDNFDWLVDYTNRYRELVT